MNITVITPEELSNNLGFILSMVNRGHMFKITQESESSILLTSIRNPTIPDLDPLPMNPVTVTVFGNSLKNEEPVCEGEECDTSQAESKEEKEEEGEQDESSQEKDEL